MIYYRTGYRVIPDKSINLQKQSIPKSAGLKRLTKCEDSSIFEVGKTEMELRVNCEQITA
jgi:hypothetical protein